jgi:hypothetical protein
LDIPLIRRKVNRHRPNAHGFEMTIAENAIEPISVWGNRMTGQTPVVSREEEIPTTHDK